MNEKKIAICFSGAIRNFRTCLPSIQKYILNGLQPDIFVHMWTFDSKDKDKLDGKFKWRNSEVDLDYFKEILKPKKCIINKFDNHWERKIEDESGLRDIVNNLEDDKRKYARSALGMYYKIMKCDELRIEYEKENDIEYDCVIRARLDYNFYDYLYPDEIFPLKKNELIIIKDRYNETAEAFKYSNDKFFISNGETMKKMCNLFKHMKKYIKYDNTEFEGQNLMIYHSNKLNLFTKKIGSWYNYIKCQARHKINGCSTKFFIQNINSEFKIKLAYELLRNNYQILSFNKSEVNYINSSANFHVVTEKFKKKIHFMVLLDDEKRPKMRIKNNLLINHNKTYPNSTMYNINFKKLYVEEIIDFIISSKMTHETYKLSKSIQVKGEIGDKVKFQIPDRGFYSSLIVNIDKKVYELEKQIAGKYNKTIRDKIKIVDIFKYYKDGILPSNYRQPVLKMKKIRNKLNNLI